MGIALDGSGSKDPEGQTIQYRWEFTSRPAGSRAAFSDPVAAKPTFVPDVMGDYSIRLTVSDGKRSTAAETFTVAVQRSNSLPTASAGGDQATLIGVPVTLDGSRSFDPDGQLISYSWTVTSRPPGSRAEVSSVNLVRPTLTPDISGVYVVALTVSDGQGPSAPSTTTITAGSANVEPVADPGADQTVLLGKPVTLDATASRDPNGDLLTFFWKLVSKPRTSIAELSAEGVARPTFTPDVLGDYLLSLVVSDGKASSAMKYVKITAKSENIPPVAAAGPDQTVMVNSMVTLNGAASEDKNGDTLTYEWTVVTMPPNSTAAATLAATASSPRATFKADLKGEYVIGLIVKDRESASPMDTVTVTAQEENVPPVAVAKTQPLNTVTVGKRVILDGTGSSDRNGDRMDFTWALTAVPPNSKAPETLTGSRTAVASFLTDEPGTYVATLVVNDRVSSSQTVLVSIEATRANQPPVAVAGPAERTTFVSQPVVLDGSASEDQDKDPITAYTWSLIAKPTASASLNLLAPPAGAAAPAAGALTPVVSLVPDAPGTYVVSLTVTSGSAASGFLTSKAAVVSVIAASSSTGIVPPKANVTDPAKTPGQPQAKSGIVNRAVALSGASDPVDALVEFEWALESGPNGAVIQFIGVKEPSPVFITDTAGQYVISLLVRQGALASSKVYVTLNITAQ